MNTTRNFAITMIFLLAFFMLTSDTCLALDRKRPIGKKFPCKADKDCGCGNGERPECLGGQCWCFSPPSSANKHT
ncbi:Nodule Cysteine-Rich (NCR) secreted peptide-like protein [Medicago truncatula]|uniref:Nodule Cysteine-Rich (NCR) secreted peptide-like protein n=1 Tax=Medicago truncatula TaxID=3880 RepID=A0A072UTU0_MEDTR|nr:Nodule Cysteine-Rich (NCR) secreted peptide-like protein [Medicago truncatula]